MVISSRTPEGTPGRCAVCGSAPAIEPSRPPGDAPCPACGHLIWFTRDDTGDGQVITLTGPLMRAGAPERLWDSLASRKRLRLVLDLNDVPYFPSEVLARLLALYRKVAANRGTLRLRGIHPDLREVFRVCRLDHLIEA